MRRRFWKIYQNFTYWAPKGAAPLFGQIPIPQAYFLPSLVEIGLVDAGRTTDAAPWHKLSWPSARWAKNDCIFITDSTNEFKGWKAN